MRFIDANYTTLGDIKEWLTFDDVLLMPGYSPFSSRNDPKISTKCKFSQHYMGDIPLISANMDTITESSMAIEMWKAGGLGVLHRFYPEKSKYLDDVKKVVETTGYVAVSIGGNTDPDILNDILKICPNPIVCLDMANVYSKPGLEQIKRIRKNFDRHIELMVGNISTAEAAAALVELGVDAIRVGQGNGSVCQTRVVTGCGTPQLSAIMNCRRAINSMRSNCVLIADGSIRNAGDIMKCLSVGADAVMIGGLFSGTDECPGEFVIDKDSGQEYKKYRGQSSKDFLNDIGRTDVASEGTDIMVPRKGPVANIIKELVGGIRSGMSYIGAASIDEIFKKASLQIVSSATRIENLPHAKLISV